jgi:tetratricopeptide (TPR) repeat protein
MAFPEKKDGSLQAFGTRLFQQGSKMRNRLMLALKYRIFPLAVASACLLIFSASTLAQDKFITASHYSDSNGPDTTNPTATVAVGDLQTSAPEPEAVQLSEQAKDALEAHHWQEASTALEKLAKLMPTNPEVHANLGLAYYFEGRTSQALAAFTRALALRPQMPRARAMTGICQAELGRDAEAIAILAPAFHKTSDPEIGRLIGLHLQRSYTELKQFDKAITTGEELLKRYPHDPEILFQVSRNYGDRSYELMTDLMRSAPDSVWMHYANGQVEESLARYDVAKAEYEQVLKQEANLPGVHYRLGRVILLSGPRTPESLAEATRAFEEELAIGPRNPAAEYELGEINREQGNYESAIAHFSRAVSQQPNFVEARIGLGRTFIKVGQPAQAVTQLREAVRLDPENKVSHVLLANAYKSSGDLAASQAEFETYRKLNQANISRLVPPAGAPTAQQVDP